MTDHHIHIGQFNELYYDALEVFEAIEEAGAKFGIDEARFSSTSSCRDDVEFLKIEEETSYALSYSGNLKVSPYLWFVPRYAEENISVFSAVKSFDYCGIKLHPAAQKWDFENPRHKKCMEEIFEWSAQNKKPVLVHSGTLPEDFPTRFAPFAIERPDSTLILAHSNPVKECSELVNGHPNIFCDIAYIEKKNLEKLLSLVNDHLKILFGTDFPVTHYFNNHLFGKKHSLKEEYEHDCKILNLAPTISPPKKARH